MAKRSKKKNPNALTSQQKADIIFNKTLDDKKKGLDVRLNITLGIVVGLCIIAFLLMPVVNMNFSGKLSELTGAELSEGEKDTALGVTVNMSFLNFLTAPAGGYDGPIRYLSEHTNTKINSSILYAVFSSKVTEEDEQMLGNAYTMFLIISILWLVSWTLWFCAICVSRKKNKDGAFLLSSSIAFISLSLAQWLAFVIVAIASAEKAQIQPHIASYLIMAGAVAVAAVYGLYRSKVKKLNKARRNVPVVADGGKEK